MAAVFDNIITQGVRSGQIPARTDAARSWYRMTAQNYNKVTSAGTERRTTSRINERQLMKDDGVRLTSSIKPGNMYMFMYDPKHKDTLPYYDRFPIIFPFAVESDRFWGINLHYLPIQLRAQLMDGLYDVVNNQRFDESTKLRISYSILNRASKFRWFKPCVKQYLFSQLNSRFAYVYPSEWDIALFLPLERFSKASKTMVWADSKKMVTGTK